MKGAKTMITKASVVEFHRDMENLRSILKEIQEMSPDQDKLELDFSVDHSDDDIPELETCLDIVIFIRGNKYRKETHIGGTASFEEEPDEFLTIMYDMMYGEFVLNAERENELTMTSKVFKVYKILEKKLD